MVDKLKLFGPVCEARRQNVSEEVDEGKDKG